MRPNGDLKMNFNAEFPEWFSIIFHAASLNFRYVEHWIYTTPPFNISSSTMAENSLSSEDLHIYKLSNSHAQ